MKKKFTKRLLSWVMAAAMVISMLPISAMATGTEGAVARIVGGGTYGTLDEALQAASVNTEGNDVTIELLADATLPTTSFPAGKSITIDGGVEKHTIDGNQAYLNIAGTIVFQNCEMNMHGVPNGHWMYLYMASNGSLTFKNSTVTIDGTDAADNTTAMYFPEPGDPPADFAVENSTVVIKNCRGNGISWGGNTSHRRNTIKITDSNFTIDNCAEKNTAGGGGIIGTFDITITDSTVRVTNNKSYGSNGSNYDISGSTVEYSNNGTHGLSASNLTIEDNSKITAVGNGNHGVTFTGKMTMDGTSSLIATENGSGGFGGGLRIGENKVRTASAVIEPGAVLTLENNFRHGMQNFGTFEAKEGSKITITGNNMPATSGESDKDGCGGGVYNHEGGTIMLPSNAVIYNNTAAYGGDDIYNFDSNESDEIVSTITFGKVGSDWVLDDCDHYINGWYDDGKYDKAPVPGVRWEAHKEADADNHIELIDNFGDDGLMTITNDQGLKAAHGKDPVDKTSYPGLDKTIVVGDNEVKQDDVAAGDDVNFKLTSNVPNDLYNYLNPEDVYPPVVDGDAQGEAEDVIMDGRGEYVLTFHDQMDDMLVDATAPVVTLDRPDGQEDVILTADTHYNYTTDTGDGCDFHIVIDLVALYEADVIKDADIEAATPIVVTYTATLDEDAIAGTYENTAWVTYENGNSSEVIVTVDTYGLNIFKYDQATVSTDEDGTWKATGLEGAVFTLTKEGDDTFEAMTLESDANGYITVNGLDAGTYILTETTPPEGYVGSSESLTIVIGGENGQENTLNIVDIRFANSLIPHTGGMGTTMFSIVGGALIATAGVIFVISRKKRARNAA